jgi:hypothetical protein
LGRPVAAALALAVLAATVAGCGSSGGVAAGATVDVYVSARLCPGAREALSRADGRAGEVEVRALCLRPSSGRGAEKVDLATQGSNARRASEDSAAVAFLEEPGGAAEFAQPIVEEAGIAFLEAGSGEAAMGRVLRAIADAGSSGSLREKVRDNLG